MILKSILIDIKTDRNIDINIEFAYNVLKLK